MLFESSQLCSEPKQPHAGNSELFKGAGVQNAHSGECPSFFACEMQGHSQPTSRLPEHAPIHGCQTGLSLKLCWKYPGLEHVSPVQISLHGA